MSRGSLWVGGGPPATVILSYHLPPGEKVAKAVLTSGRPGSKYSRISIETAVQGHRASWGLGTGGGASGWRQEGPAI